MRARTRRAGVALAAIASLGAAAGQSPAAAARPAPPASLLAQLLASPPVPLGRAAVPLPGSSPLGPLRAGRWLQLGIALAPRDPPALEAYATAVSTPGSPSFGHFIDPAEFRSRFGPTSESIGEVEALFKAEGFRLGAPSRNGLIVPVSAPASVVERALHVSLAGYRLPGGATGWAARGAPELPAPIAGAVTAVLGLDNLVGPHALLRRPPRPAHAAGAARSPLTAPPRSSGGGPVACAAAASGASAYGGWTFNELAQAYGVEGLYEHAALGQGETVALFELEPFARSDIETFDTCYFGSTAAEQMLGRLSVVAVDGGIPAGSGSGEAALDVEDVSALAPGARIEVYEAPSSTIGTEYATNDVYNAIVNADTANVISTSWGLCEPALEVAAPGAQEVENELFEEAAAQGQSVFAAAGDSGSNDCAAGSTPTSPPLAVDDPASQPFVVGVGGTSLRSDTQPPVQTVWNDGPSGGGGGGGISATWPSPGWQADSGVPGVSNSYSRSAAYAFCEPAASPGAGVVPPCREVPDVTIDADEDTGTSFYEAAAGGWGTIGGTSTAAPMWAAITTDIASSDSCAGLASNPESHERDLGFVAPALYEAEATTPSGQDFDNITAGSNDIFGLGKGYPATTGFNLAAGLGSPVASDPGASAPAGEAGTDTGLAASLCELLTPSASHPAITGLSPGHGPVTGGNTVLVRGRGLSGPGVTVEAVTFGAARATSFRVETGGAISVRVPAAAPRPGTGGETRGTPGPVNVTVTLALPSGVTTTPPTATASRYIYTAGPSSAGLPSVSGVGPSGGPVAGGNVVDVFGSGFGAAGPIASVTFGGVPSPHWSYLTNYELQVTVPPEGAATQCATGTGFEPSNTCQVQVVVTGRAGKSPTSKILPPYFGKMTPNDKDIVVPAAGTEIDPAPSEYDYAPRPRITSVSPQPYVVSSLDPIVLSGSGFDVLTLDWVYVGKSSKAADAYASFTSITPTSITLHAALPAAGSKARLLPGGISVLGLGGLSNAAAFRYKR